LQDADFVEEQPKKKRKKDKGKKGKQRAEAAEEAADEISVEEGVSAVDRVKKVKKAMEEYKALDHEDMVSSSSGFQYNSTRSMTFSFKRLVEAPFRE
jgi:protein KRI1